MVICYGSPRQLVHCLTVGWLHARSGATCCAWSHVAICREALAPTRGAHDHGYFLLLVRTILNFLKDIGASGSTDRKSFQENTKKKK